MNQQNLNWQYEMNESEDKILEDTLARIVDQVANDAKIKPSQYLKDSIVPEGGE